jgi:hypothetical protein
MENFGTGCGSPSPNLVPPLPPPPLSIFIFILELKFWNSFSEKKFVIETQLEFFFKDKNRNLRGKGNHRRKRNIIKIKIFRS